MKLKQQHTEVSSGNVAFSSTFSIKNSPKAFAILSSGLYSNKIAAIIREPACNAFDAQVDKDKLLDDPEYPEELKQYLSPKGTKFDVLFPTSFYPYFTIRDYGIGLDNHQVETIYTTYFESTKQDSNDYIGALGLGSKSPFSYTKNFTVISTKNGHRWVYNMFINAEGLPQPALMHEGPLEDFYPEGVPEKEKYNGLEVRIPVDDSSDYGSFVTEAAEVFRWFDELPNFRNRDDFSVPAWKYKHHNIAPGVHVVGNRGYNHILYAKQGNVGYPISLSRSLFDRVVDYAEKTDAQKQLQSDVVVDEEMLNFGLTRSEAESLRRFYEDVLRQTDLILEFNIGELDVAASREELSYETYTIKSIINKIISLQEGLDNYVRNLVHQKESNWDKAVCLVELSKEGIFSSATQTVYKELDLPQIDIGQGYARGGFQWTDRYQSINEPTSPDIEIWTNCRGRILTKLKTLAANPRPKIATESKSKTVEAPRMVSIQNRPSHYGDNFVQTTFIVNDTKRGPIKKVKEYLRIASLDHVIVLGHTKHDFQAVIDYIKSEMAAIEVLEPNIKLLSGILSENPSIAEPPAPVDKTIKVYELGQAAKRSYYSEPEPNLVIKDRIDIKTVDNSIVFYLNYEGTSLSDSEYTSKQLMIAWNIVSKINPDSTIIGVPKRAMKHVPADWKHFVTYLNDTMSVAIDDNRITGDYAIEISRHLIATGNTSTEQQFGVLNCFSGTSTSVTALRNLLIGQLEGKTYGQDVREALIDMSANKQATSVAAKLILQLKPSLVSTVSATGHYSERVKQYKMFRFTEFGWRSAGTYDEQTEAIVEYIKLIDTTEG